MRTTITLDPQSRLLVEQLMSERGISFKEAVNEAIHRGLSPTTTQRVVTQARSMGRPHADLTKALALSAELEDGALVARLAEGR